MKCVFLFLYTIGVVSCISVPSNVVGQEPNIENNALQSDVDAQHQDAYWPFPTFGIPVSLFAGFVGVKAYQKYVAKREIARQKEIALREETAQQEAALRKEAALVEEADSLLEQMDAYIAQIPSERSETTQGRLWEHKKELSKRIQQRLEVPVSSSALLERLTRLEQHKRLPNGMGAKHAHLAQRRYGLSNRLPQERDPEYQKLEQKRSQVSSELETNENKKNAIQALLPAFESPTDPSVWDDAIFSILEQAYQILGNTLTREDFMDTTEADRGLKFTLIKSLLKAHGSLVEGKITTLQIEEHNTILELTLALKQSQERRLNQLSRQSFGLKRGSENKVALDAIEIWLGVQATIPLIQYLSLEGEDGGHAILIATDPVQNHYRLFDPNTGIYLWNSKDEFVQDVYTYLVRSGLGLPNGKEAFLNRDLDLRSKLEVEFSQSNVQGEMEEKSLVGRGICYALVQQVAQYLLQHPSTDHLTREKLGLQDIHTPNYFENKVAYYRGMGMPEKELAMINYWLESQPTIPFEEHASLREIYDMLTTYGLLMDEFILQKEKLGKGEITQEGFDKSVSMQKMYHYLTWTMIPNFNKEPSSAHAESQKLGRMLELAETIFNKYRKPDQTWKESELRQVFSWLYSRAQKHVYPKPTDGKERTTYQTLKSSELTLP